MKVIFHSIGNMVRKATNESASLALTQFDVTFSSPFVSGESFLDVVETKLDRPYEQYCGALLQKELDLPIAVDRVVDLKEIGRSTDVEESIVFLGARGHFEIVATLVRHLRTGEGSICSVCGADFTLFVDALPPFALEIAEGHLLRFKTGELSFWLQ